VNFGWFLWIGVGFGIWVSWNAIFEEFDRDPFGNVFWLVLGIFRIWVTINNILQEFLEVFQEIGACVIYFY
jgi:hypothetical protein